MALLGIEHATAEEKELCQQQQAECDFWEAAFLSASLVDCTSARWSDYSGKFEKAGRYGLDVCFTGGADGADLCWAQRALREQHTCAVLSFQGHYCKLPGALAEDRRIKRIVLDDAELAAATDKVNKANSMILNRSINRLRGTVGICFLQRDYYQIRHADSLYAVGWIEHGAGDDLIPISKTEGGTAWAVAMFAMLRVRPLLLNPCSAQRCLPVFLFCQRRERWFQCKATARGFVWQDMRSELPPRPQGRYAAIGSRRLLSCGQRAIEEL
jgi:hypothetical protein